MPKQTIELPGTRIDTLWSTVEKGENESGEYEKKQRVAPRTFEEAVTDENGVNLKTKLAEMQEDIDSFVAGELPDNVLYVPDGATVPEEAPLLNADRLQGHSAEEFALKGDVPEAWDYNVTNNQPITFYGPNGNEKFRIYSDTSNNFVIQVYINNAWENVGYINLNGNTSLNKNLHLTREVPIYFDTANSVLFRLFCGANNELKFQTYVNGNWLDSIQLSSDASVNVNKALRIFSDVSMQSGTSSVFKHGSSVKFNDAQNNYEKFSLFENNNILTLLYRPNATLSFATALTIAEDGSVSFTKNISAPNIATTAALAVAEQQITEQDIALIAAEQANTDLDLRLTALEAKEGLNGI